MASNNPPLHFQQRPQIVPFAEVFQHLAVGALVINLAHIEYFDGSKYDDATGQGEYYIHLASGQRITLTGSDARLIWQTVLQMTGRANIG